MAANPDPTRITDALWKHYEDCAAVIPGLRLGGIYANKSGYHNTVKANQQSYAPNYSITLHPDLDFPPKDKARAIDLTMSTAEMMKRTGYLKRAAEHPFDDRLNGLREFIGTLDGVRVFCMIKDDVAGTTWRVDWTRDPSHLWHIHESFFTEFCADSEAIDRVTTVLSGETYEQYLGRKGNVDVFLAQVKGSQAVYVSDGQTWRSIISYPTQQKLQSVGIPLIVFDDQAQFNDGCGTEWQPPSGGEPTEVADHTHEGGDVVRVDK